MKSLVLAAVLLLTACARDPNAGRYKEIICQGSPVIDHAEAVAAAEYGSAHLELCSE